LKTLEEIKPVSKILIVDDAPENIFCLQKLLELKGYKVESANSGDEALKMVLKTDFALILLDVNMPGMSGYEVAEMLRDAKKTKHIPLIFLTAMDKDRNLTEFSETGAVDFLTKPFDPDYLFIKINNFIRLNYIYNEVLTIRSGAGQIKDMPS
jgi:CheY-like chemotaxis protein